MRLETYRGDPMPHDLDPAHAADVFGPRSQVPERLWEAINPVRMPYPVHVHETEYSRNRVGRR